MRLGLTEPQLGCLEAIQQEVSLPCLKSSFSFKSVSLPRNLAACELQQKSFTLFSLLDIAHNHC